MSDWRDSLRQKFLTPGGSLFLFILLVLIPILAFMGTLLSIAVSHCYAQFWLKHKLIYAFYGSILLLICVAFVAYILERGKNLYDEFKAWIQQIISPLIIGATIGVATSVIYMFIIIKVDFEQFNQIMAEALGIYLAGCGLFIGFYGIYSEKVPIMDLRTLMDLLSNDLEHCERALFWSYPGLSFGSVSVEPRYPRYYRAMSSLIARDDIYKEFLMLNESEIEAFYKPYIERTGKYKNEEEKKHYLNRVDIAIKDSKGFIKKIQAACDQAGSEVGKCNYHFFKPEFRFQAIIIDDIVYLLHPVGLPVKIGAKWEFTRPEKPDLSSPVEFITVRIKNSAVGAMVKDAILSEYTKLHA